MDAERREFEATIAAADRGGAYVPVPAEVVTALGGRGRIPVRELVRGGEASRDAAASHRDRRTRPTDL